MKHGSIRFCAMAVALLMAATLTDFAFAQSQQAQIQEQAYQITSIRVKPGMGLEWQNFLKTELIPVMKKSGVTQFETWETAFGDPDEFVMVTPLKNMAELDGPGAMSAAGEAGLKALMARIQQIVHSANFSVIRSRNDWNMPAKPGYVPKLAVLITNTVAVDRTDEFEKSSKGVMAAAAKTNMKGWLVSRLALGGNPNEFYTLVLFDAFADMQAFVPAFLKALNEAKLTPQPGMVTQRRYEVLRYIPDLSFLPATP